MQGYGFFYGAPSNRKLATPFRQWDDLKLPDNVCRSQDCHCHPRRSTAGDSCHCVSSAPCEMQHLQPLGNSICSVPLLRWGLRGRHLWIFLVIVWQWPEVVERRIASSGGINKLIKYKGNMRFFNRRDLHCFRPSCFCSLRKSSPCRPRHLRINVRSIMRPVRHNHTRYRTRKKVAGIFYRKNSRLDKLIIIIHLPPNENPPTWRKDNCYYQFRRRHDSPPA